MKRFTMWVDKHLEEGLLFILFVTAVISIALQVFSRFILDSSLSWSEELARYTFIWLIYIAVPYGIKKHRHITLDIIYDIVPPKIKKYMDFISTVIVACFAILMLYYGSIVVSMISQFGQQSSAMEINMVYVYAAVPVGMFLTAVRSIQNITFLIRNWNMRKEEEDLTS
ncbi:TRAP transporter small permease [Oceanobacillus jeddahense]|uniref:TRAP transporter small permease n=1 Tax=Oceanobacillus jeddahense TaxID=1462527 RepID=UPI00363D3C54